MIQGFRRVLSATLAAYTLVLAGVYALSGDPGGESGVEWLYVAPVPTAAATRLFLAVRRPENAVGTLISLSGAALAWRRSTDGWTWWRTRCNLLLWGCG